MLFCFIFPRIFAIIFATNLSGQKIEIFKTFSDFLRRVLYTLCMFNTYVKKMFYLCPRVRTGYKEIVVLFLKKKMTNPKQ